MNRQKLDARKDQLALLFLLLLVVWFSYEMVLGGKVPFFRDLSTYFYPMRFSLAESFRVGELPLWDRHMGMGFPLLADFQSGAFYPPHLFYLILPFLTAVRATFLFHYIIAATGTYILCREWKYPVYLAITGALLFTFGGTIVSLTNVMNHFQAAVWLPWLLLLWERVLRSGSKGMFLLLVLAALLQFLAGSPEIYAMSMVLLFLEGMRIKMAEVRAGYCQPLSLLLAVNLLVIALGMVQVLPTLELLMESRRQAPVPYQEATLWSLHPMSLLNIFLLDKAVNMNLGSGLELYLGRDIPFIVSHYLGAILLFGFSLWLVYSPWKEKNILLFFLLISLLITLGKYTPVYSFLFRYVPLFSAIRFPEKFFFLTYGLLFFVTLRGLFIFFESDAADQRGLVVLSSVFLLLLGSYLFLRLDREALAELVAWSTGKAPFSAANLDSSSGILVSLERQVILSLGILLLFFLGKKGLLQPRVFKGLVILLVFIDLYSAHQPYQFLIDPRVVYDGKTIMALPDAEPVRLFSYPGDSSLHPSYYRIERQPHFAELHSILFSNLLPNTGIFRGFDYMQEIDALGRRDYTRFLVYANRLPRERLYRLLGALNVKYIQSFRPLAEEDITLVQHFPQYPSWLYRVDRIVPRAYIVSTATQEKEPRKILERLASADFDPLKEVILEEALPAAAKADFRASANISRYLSRAVDIDASLNGPGILVLADSFYPGWRVYVDGKEEKIPRANLFFRGVALSPGEHHVEFRYRPRSFAIGLAVSVATLCLLALWTFREALLRRRRRG